MNKTPVILRIVIGIQLILLAGCASTPNKPAAAVSPPASSSTATVQTQPKPTLPASASKAPAPFDGEGWQTMFDGKSFAGWRETAFASHGQASLESGAILLNAGDPFTGLNWTNTFPKMNYEIAFDAMRVSGSDFFCGLTVPVGDSFCSLIVGGGADRW